MATTYALVIFDADGTLTPPRPGSCGRFAPVLMPNVLSRCAELRTAGAVLVIASNQSARRHTAEIADQLSWTAWQIGAADYEYETMEQWQKPNKLMLELLMDEFNVAPADTLMVGDQMSDFEAARHAGCDFEWSADFFGWEHVHPAEMRRFWDECYNNGVGVELLRECLRQQIAALPHLPATEMDDAMRAEMKRSHSIRRGWGKRKRA